MPKCTKKEEKRKAIFSNNLQIIYKIYIPGGIFCSLFLRKYASDDNNTAQNWVLKSIGSLTVFRSVFTCS